MQHQVGVTEEEEAPPEDDAESEVRITARIVDWPARGIYAKD